MVAHDDSEASFVVLHTLSSPAEGEMVSDILRQNGVRAVVQSGANDAFSPVFSAVSPGVAVLVDERDFDRAKETLCIVLWRGHFATHRTSVGRGRRRKKKRSNVQSSTPISGWDLLNLTQAKA